MRKKKWVRPFLDDEVEYLVDEIDLKDISKKIYLEIGMGMGDFITNSAKKNEDIFYIGLEKDETCVARAILKAKELELNNLKIMLKDASNLKELFPDESIDNIYLLFSDPWPKKRTHKRRLTYNTFLDIYYDLLKDNGSLIFKSDNDDFFNDSVEYFKNSKFKIIEINNDYHAIKRDDILTGYEDKFIKQGKNINYLLAKKESE